MTLLLKSCMSGLAKFASMAPPDERKIEQITQKAFKFAKRGHEDIIMREEFLEYCKKTPEIVAWMAFYDGSADLSQEEKEYPDSDVELEMGFRESTHKTTMARNLDLEQGLRVELFKEREKRHGKPELQKWHGTLEHVTPSYP